VVNIGIKYMYHADMVKLIVFMSKTPCRSFCCHQEWSQPQLIIDLQGDSKVNLLNLPNGKDLEVNAVLRSEKARQVEGETKKIY
jgi:hypothetical protein